MKTISTIKSHGGTQGVYQHMSKETNTQMTFSVFVPGGGGPFPVLWYLSGLTCTHANVTEKGEYRSHCAKYGIIFVAPDTSPRGESVVGDPGGMYDFGIGAGFYLDAIKSPYSKHYKMRSYVESELPELLAAHFPVDMMRQSITGHSMGGHGALTIGLRNPKTFKCISAFSPIVSLSNCSWGTKALKGYLGDNRSQWREYDACALINSGARTSDILVDQGLEDEFLQEQLKPEYLESACENAGQPLTLRRHAGYDHSYYFISTFMREHIAWHAKRL